MDPASGNPAGYFLLRDVNRNRMENTLNLLQGHHYTVIKPFIDYDKIVHGIGEHWIYLGTHFLPYEDGLTLHVVKNGMEEVYRLQWRKEEQAGIIDNFNDYIELL